MLSRGKIFCEHYRIVRRIGRGGMGAVYAAKDLRTERQVAIKVMLPGLLDDRDSAERFRLEATALAEVRSDHLAPILDAGVEEESECPYLVMDLLPGKDLSQRLKDGPLGWDTALQLLSQLAKALDAIHAAGIVHRDLKPENVFLEDVGSEVRVRLLDFGVAKRISEGEALTTLAVGTPAYMAPEQLRGDGDVGPAADIYGLGCLAALLVNSSKGVVPRGFRSWLQTACHADPAARYKTATQALEALAQQQKRRAPTWMPIVAVAALGLALLPLFSPQPVLHREHPTPLRASVRSITGLVPPPPAPSQTDVESRASPRKVSSCLPPYSIDSQGIKRFHPHCLSRQARAACDPPYQVTPGGTRRYLPHCLAQ